MAITPKQRKELGIQGQKLKAVMTISADQLSDAAVEHVRRYLAERELAKVRIRAKRREDCQRVATELADRLQCELIQRVGRVALLYRPPRPEQDRQTGESSPPMV
ncbi:MAG: YhbY family RNA-binding protein [Planctomycetota bacterium]